MILILTITFQGSTPKNDFCRILSRNSVLDPLSLVLSRVLDEEGDLADLVEARIASIFFIFSQAENHVKEMVAERTVLHSKIDLSVLYLFSPFSLTISCRSFERSEANVAHAPGHDVEIHQELVYAFYNP